jgi:lipopolysaccharide assembly outer membrane protein LptD (OstA)
MIAGYRYRRIRRGGMAVVAAALISLGAARPLAAQTAVSLDASDRLSMSRLELKAVLLSAGSDYVNFLMRADAYSTSRATGEWTAAGVQIFYGARTIEADQLVYMKREKAIVANGVMLRDRDGQVIYAQHYLLPDELHQVLTRFLGGG